MWYTLTGTEGLKSAAEIKVVRPDLSLRVFSSMVKDPLDHS